MDGRVKDVTSKGTWWHLSDFVIMQSIKPLWKNTVFLPIDLVVVNLYPFRETIAKPNVSLEDAIENIDIGGPTMVRSAAKNNAYVGIVVNPDSL